MGNRGPLGPLRGTLGVPGDKSISHRALILAGLAPGRAHIEGLNQGLDVRATANCLMRLGVGVTWDETNPVVQVDGCGWDGLREPETELDAGNSGTTLRCLLGVCAAIESFVVLTGDASLRRRPMLRVVAPLRQMGASIDGRMHGDRAPLSVRGGELSGIDLELEVASAQVKTALLLAGLNASGRTVVLEPGRSRDHTERMLRAQGIDVSVQEGEVSVRGGDALTPIDRSVPGDISSALFLIAAALLIEDSDLTIEGVGLNPTRTAALDVLIEMGADLTIESTDEWGGEPVGSVRARASELHGVDIEASVIPRLIDEIPILGVVAARAQGKTVIRGASELRVKESDRIATMCSGLAHLGVEVEELPDGMVVQGPATLRGAEVDSSNDHRVAMALAVAGMAGGVPVTVRGWSCVDTSFPEFLDLIGAARGAPR